jgi:peptidyl-prolyl cis-trans isomerase C
MKTLYLFLPCLLLIAACSPKDPQNPKFVVAKVNGQKITRSELTAGVALVAQRFGAQLDSLTPEQKNLLDWQMTNELVNEKLIKSAATKIKNSGIEAKVEEQLKRMKEAAGSDAQFQERLKSANLDEAKLREEITKQNTMLALIDHHYAAEVALEPGAAEKFYQDNPQSFDQKEMVMARHILVLAREGSSKEEISAAKKKAEDARKEIVAGKKFEEVALAISEDPGSKNRGGTLPPFGRGQMVPPFEKMAFDSPVNKLSPVFQTNFGFHFLEVLDKRGARKISLDEARVQIEQQLINDKRTKAAGKLIEKLRSEAKVTVNITDPSKKEPAATTPPAPPAP